jgi:hypothetical protein
MEFEAAVSLAVARKAHRGANLAIYYRSGDNIRVIWVNTADGDRFALKVNITIAKAGVYAGLDFNYIAIVGIVNGCLDVVKIRRGIVIDGDCPRLTGNCQKQTSKNKGHPFHF